MKFYSYTNQNKNYTKAISLNGVRSIKIIHGSGKSTIRFSICINYFDENSEYFEWLTEIESKQVYREILSLLKNN